jgi:hypothetical protein
MTTPVGAQQEVHHLAANREQFVGFVADWADDTTLFYYHKDEQGFHIAKLPRPKDGGWRVEHIATHQAEWLWAYISNWLRHLTSDERRRMNTAPPPTELREPKLLGFQIDSQPDGSLLIIPGWVPR